MSDLIFSQKQLDEIVDYEGYPVLADNGPNDQEGFQIFTPEFIVKDMIKLIGKDTVSDIEKTVLEPASGDGAFTVRILDLRLKKLVNDEKFMQKSLIALSTIYSIEMDEELIKKQRNNIFSLLMFYMKKNKQMITEDYKLVAKKIIITNFIWGETNIDIPLRSRASEPIGWYMPTTLKKKFSDTLKYKIRFARWNITEGVSKSTFEFEEWEKNDTYTDYSELGGVFGD